MSARRKKVRKNSIVVANRYAAVSLSLGVVLGLGAAAAAPAMASESGHGHDHGGSIIGSLTGKNVYAQESYVTNRTGKTIYVVPSDSESAKTAAFWTGLAKNTLISGAENIGEAHGASATEKAVGKGAGRLGIANEVLEAVGGLDENLNHNGLVAIKDGETKRVYSKPLIQSAADDAAGKSVPKNVHLDFITTGEGGLRVSGFDASGNDSWIAKNDSIVRSDPINHKEEATSGERQTQTWEAPSKGGEGDTLRSQMASQANWIRNTTDHFLIVNTQPSKNSEWVSWALNLVKTVATKTTGHYGEAAEKAFVVNDLIADGMDAFLKEHGVTVVAPGQDRLVNVVTPFDEVKDLGQKFGKNVHIDVMTEDGAGGLRHSSFDADGHTTFQATEYGIHDIGASPLTVGRVFSKGPYALFTSSWTGLPATQEHPTDLNHPWDDPNFEHSNTDRDFNKRLEGHEKYLFNSGGVSVHNFLNERMRLITDGANGEKVITDIEPGGVARFDKASSMMAVSDDGHMTRFDPVGDVHYGVYKDGVIGLQSIVNTRTGTSRFAVDKYRGVFPFDHKLKSLKEWDASGAWPIAKHPTEGSAASEKTAESNNKPSTFGGLRSWSLATDPETDEFWKVTKDGEGNPVQFYGHGKDGSWHQMTPESSLKDYDNVTGYVQKDGTWQQFSDPQGYLRGDTKTDGRAKEEADRKAKEDADAKAKEDADAKAKEEADRKAKEEADRKAKEDADRKAKEDADAKAKEDADRKAKEDADRKAKEDADAKAKEDADRKAKEDADRKAKEDADRKAKEDADRKAKEDADRKAKEDADRKAKEDADRKAKEDADRKAKEDADRKAKEEADRRAKEEADRRAKEEADRRAKEEADRRAKEEADRRAKEEADRRAKEEADRRAKEEADRRAKEEADRRAKEEADRRAKEEADRRAKEDADRRAKEEADRRAKEEADRRAKEDADRRAKEEADRRAKEEADRRAREEADRRAEDHRREERR